MPDSSCTFWCLPGTMSRHCHVWEHQSITFSSQFPRLFPGWDCSAPCTLCYASSRSCPGAKKDTGCLKQNDAKVMQIKWLEASWEGNRFPFWQGLANFPEHLSGPCSCPWHPGGPCPSCNAAERAEPSPMLQLCTAGTVGSAQAFRSHLQKQHLQSNAPPCRPQSLQVFSRKGTDRWGEKPLLQIVLW